MSTSNQKKALQTEFLKKRYAIQDQFFSEQRCADLLAIIMQFRQDHVLPEIYRKFRGRSLRYSVIDGEKIEQHLPEIVQLHEQIKELVREISNEDMVPWGDKKAGVNVNITPRGGSSRWHYDRNAITVLLYLNDVEGGELELYPNYRIFLKNKGPIFLQQWLDSLLQVSIVRRLFGKEVVVKPAQGRMVVIRGNRSLHSVRPVEDDKERVNIILTYDLPHAAFYAGKRLNTYLYTQEAVVSDRF
ncbi:MAG TPA: 2OG-Fe(II) oxygenase [Ktedonobacteraceae bacterium]